jgi:hypothetical protein
VTLFNKQLPSPGIELMSDDGVVKVSSPVLGASVSNVEAAISGTVWWLAGASVTEEVEASDSSESVVDDGSSTSGVEAELEETVDPWVLDGDWLSLESSVATSLSVDDSLDVGSASVEDSLDTGPASVEDPLDTGLASVEDPLLTGLSSVEDSLDV